MSDQNKSLINIELVPKEIITDFLGPTAKSLGEGLGGIANFIMTPLRMMGVLGEKSYQDFVEKVNQKTDKIPLENRDTTYLGLALKVMEDSRYQLENENMRLYFSNLIAGLVDDRKNNFASPRFSTILSNLVTDDALVLREIFSAHPSSLPCVDIRIHITNSTQGFTLKRNLILKENDVLDYISSMVTLVSYGLIEISDGELLSEKNQDIYKKFEKRKEYIELVSSSLEQYKDFDVFQNKELEVSTFRKHLELTTLGEAFCSLIFREEEE